MISSPGSLDKIIILCLIIVFGYSNALRAEGDADDILFFFVEKVNHFQQSATGALEFKDYGFATAIFSTGKGEIESASVTVPGNQGEFTHVNTGRMHAFDSPPFATIDALNQEFPDGEYQISIKSEHNNIVNQSLKLGRLGTKEDFPPPPKIELRQDGKKASPDEIDPAKDLILNWTPFATGKVDPEKILDDVILILTDDCNGHVVGSSGLPFTDSHLTFRDNSYTIKADSLRPGVPYSFRVEHMNNTDTVRNGNIPALAIYIAITIVDINTKGKAIDGSCSA